MTRLDALTHALVSPFAQTVIDVDVAALPPAARADAVEFVVHRINTMSSVTRLGVIAVAALFAPLMKLPGRRRVVAAISAAHPPLIGEYLRLVRGLVVSRVWETHPATLTGGVQ